MIRYLCDICGRELHPHNDLRYVVRMQICAAIDPIQSEENEDDRDYLQEMQDMIEQMDDDQSEHFGEEAYQQLRFDLCPECRRKFVESPLGREIGKICNFSQN